MKKADKNCCVRLPTELHRLAKLRAYELDSTLQEWIIKLIEEALKKTPRK